MGRSDEATKEWMLLQGFDVRTASEEGKLTKTSGQQLSRRYMEDFRRSGSLVGGGGLEQLPGH